MFTEALNENYDAAAASSLHLGAEKPYGDGYAHVWQTVEEEIDNLEDAPDKEISICHRSVRSPNSTRRFGLTEG